MCTDSSGMGRSSSRKEQRMKNSKDDEARIIAK